MQRYIVPFTEWQYRRGRDLLYNEVQDDLTELWTATTKNTITLPTMTSILTTQCLSLPKVASLKCSTMVETPSTESGINRTKYSTILYPFSSHFTEPITKIYVNIYATLCGITQIVSLIAALLRDPDASCNQLKAVKHKWEQAFLMLDLLVDNAPCKRLDRDCTQFTYRARTAKREALENEARQLKTGRDPWVVERIRTTIQVSHQT